MLERLVGGRYRRLSGIYEIRNLVTKRVYVGMTSRLYTRPYEHLSLLERGSHISKFFQEDWDLLGIETFVLGTLIECKNSDLHRLEKYYLQEYRRIGFELYNIITRDRSYKIKG